MVDDFYIFNNPFHAEFHQSAFVRICFYGNHFCFRVEQGKEEHFLSVAGRRDDDRLGSILLLHPLLIITVAPEISLDGAENFHTLVAVAVENQVVIIGNSLFPAAEKHL